MDNKTRILQLTAAFEWFAKQSTSDIVKLSFNTAVDTVAEKCRDGYIRFVKINEDISKIYETGTDEERKLIDEVIEKFDKQYKK